MRYKLMTGTEPIITIDESAKEVFKTFVDWTEEEFQKRTILIPNDPNREFDEQLGCGDVFDSVDMFGDSEEKIRLKCRRGTLCPKCEKQEQDTPSDEEQIKKEIDKDYEN